MSTIHTIGQIGGLGCMVIAIWTASWKPGVKTIRDFAKGAFYMAWACLLWLA